MKIIHFIKSSITNVLTAVFYPENEFRWINHIWLAALILIGVLLWCVFFNWGNVDINYMDWGEVWAARLQAWRVALQQGTLPFHLSDLAAMRSTYDRYFSVADMVSSPQVILLAWLEVGTYSLVNTLLLFGLATYFLLKIRKRYQLSLCSFTLMFLLFQFNGYIISHTTVGHLSWGGYFLFPAFTLYLLEVLEGDHRWRWVTKMSILLFFMFLQGSLHHVVWCFIVMGVLAVIHWKSSLQLVKAAIFTVLLSMVRVLPVFIGPHTPFKALDFIGGYPKLRSILQSLLSNTPITLAMPGKIYESPLGYWEFDIYVGWVGLGFILAFAIFFLLFLHFRKKIFPYLLIPVAILIFLSIRDNFLNVLFNNSVLASSERVTSRMMGLALAILIILAAISYQRFIEKAPRNFLILIPQIAFIIVLANDLISHTIHWDVNNGAAYLGSADRDLSYIQISNHADPQYFTLLIIGLIISLLTMGFLYWICKKEKRKSTVSNQ